MKRFLSIFLFAALALQLQATTLTINAVTAEVVTTSFKVRTFYNTGDLILIYNSTTGGFEAQLAKSRSKVFGAVIDSVTITGASTAAQKLAKLRLWLLEATTTNGYRVFVGRNDLYWNYTASTNVLRLNRAGNDQPLWFGHIDSLQVSGVSGASNKLAWLRVSAFRPFSTGALAGGESATIAAGAAAGSSPTISIVGNGVAGEITLTTGSSTTTTGVICTVTLPITAANGTRVVLTPSNDNAGAGISRVFATTTTSTFVLNASGTALTAATAYKWFYRVEQY